MPACPIEIPPLTAVRLPPLLHSALMKLRVGVVFGGRSGEHEVSLSSAASVMRALDRKKYQIIPIGIDKRGRWRVGRAPSGNAPVDPAAVLREGEPLTLIPQPVATSGKQNSRLKVDVLLPVLHGTFGEDGCMQGLFELTGIPYAGSGVAGSAAAMDKILMKRLFAAAGLPGVAFRQVLRGDWEARPRAVERSLRESLSFPMFVKPANLGSSVGISKARNAAELGPALREAARYDSRIIVEQGVDAREIECAVLGNERPQASLPGEVLSANEFYDYAAKYIDNRSHFQAPAALPARVRRRIQQLAIQAFQAVDAAGLARVDFFLERGTGNIYINEINTLPGFTPISGYPKMWQASGLSYGKLLDRVIELALERSRERGRNSYEWAAR